MKKSGFLTFCCACVPGCGQMYQGYMKRGLSLLLWFCAVIAISALTQIGIILVLLAVIWAYSFFDTFNIRALSPEQRAAFSDGFIPDAAWLRTAGLDRWMTNDRMVKVAGWGCVGIGVLILGGNLWSIMMSFLWQYIPLLANIFSRLPVFIVAVVVILLGLRILRGGSFNFGGSKNEEGEPAHGTYTAPEADDEPMFTGFTPPQPPPAAPQPDPQPEEAPEPAVVPEPKMWQPVQPELTLDNGLYKDPDDDADDAKGGETNE